MIIIITTLVMIILLLIIAIGILSYLTNQAISEGPQA